MTRFAIRRVSATPAALRFIEWLTQKHGPIAFFQSEDSSDGAGVTCLTKGELPQSPSYAQLGEIGGAPYYVDSDQYAAWGRPMIVIDLAPGTAGRFSLEGLEGVHFVSRSPYGAGVTS